MSLSVKGQREARGLPLCRSPSMPPLLGSLQQGGAPVPRIATLGASSGLPGVAPEHGGRIWLPVSLYSLHSAWAGQTAGTRLPYGRGYCASAVNLPLQSVRRRWRPTALAPRRLRWGDSCLHPPRSPRLPSFPRSTSLREVGRVQGLIDKVGNQKMEWLSRFHSDC